MKRRATIRRPKDAFYELTSKAELIDRPLVAPIIGFHTAWLYNQDPLQVATNGLLMAKLQQQALNFYGYDIVSHYLDLTTLPESLGAKVKWSGYIPSIETPLKNTNEVLNKLETADLRSLIESSKRLKASIEAIKYLQTSVGQTYPIAAFVHGPLTLIGDLLSPEFALRLIRKEPSTIKELLEKSVPLLKALSEVYIEQGADIIVIAEPTASLISAKDFQTLLFEHLNDEILGAKKRSNVILHICGRANHLLDLMSLTDADILSVDKFIDLPTAIKKYSNKIFMGNIGTTEIYTWDPLKVRNYTKELVNRAGKERLIVSTGCDIPVYTPPDNIKAMVNAVKGEA